mgnify:CR=1 FL=1
MECLCRFFWQLLLDEHNTLSVGDTHISIANENIKNSDTDCLNDSARKRIDKVAMFMASLPIYFSQK